MLQPDAACAYFTNGRPRPQKKVSTLWVSRFSAHAHTTSFAPSALHILKRNRPQIVRPGSMMATPPE